MDQYPTSSIHYNSTSEHLKYCIQIPSVVEFKILQIPPFLQLGCARMRNVQLTRAPPTEMESQTRNFLWPSFLRENWKEDVEFWTQVRQNVARKATYEATTLTTTTWLHDLEGFFVLSIYSLTADYLGSILYLMIFLFLNNVLEYVISLLVESKG